MRGVIVHGPRAGEAVEDSDRKPELAHKVRMDRLPNKNHVDVVFGSVVYSRIHCKDPVSGWEFHAYVEAGTYQQGDVSEPVVNSWLQMFTASLKRK